MQHCIISKTVMQSRSTSREISTKSSPPTKPCWKGDDPDVTRAQIDAVMSPYRSLFSVHSVCEWFVLWFALILLPIRACTASASDTDRSPVLVSHLFALKCVNAVRAHARECVSYAHMKCTSACLEWSRVVYAWMPHTHTQTHWIGSTHHHHYDSSQLWATCRVTLIRIVLVQKQ